jgi:hypothetical protein
MHARVLPHKQKWQTQRKIHNIRQAHYSPPARVHNYWAPLRLL